MQVRQYARELIECSDLAVKLTPPPRLSDSDPGPPVVIDRPGRPHHLRLAPARAVKVPPLAGMADRAQRIRIIHALANHELQAVELFAWALLAFPAAPAAYRRGLLAILAEEQRHLELYIERLHALGADFGDFGVTGHFWHQIGCVRTPLAFACIMGLTFENANLDFAQAYADAARAAGDLDTARVLMDVHRDEIRHVAFAWQWLRRLQPAGDDEWATYTANVPWPLGPSRARGKTFDKQARVAAGLSAPFIGSLEHATAERPNGRPR